MRRKCLNDLTQFYLGYLAPWLLGSAHSLSPLVFNARRGRRGRRATRPNSSRVLRNGHYPLGIMKYLCPTINHYQTTSGSRTGLYTMGILVTPDLSGIACVLDWRPSPMPFLSSVDIMQVLLNPTMSRSVLDFRFDVRQLSLFLRHCIRSNLKVVFQASGKKGLRKFLYAREFVKSGDPETFPVVLREFCNCC